MDDRDAGPLFSRTPTLDDLVRLCRHLNEAGARYVVIGGLAVIHYGYPRATGDIDLLVDPSPDNVERIKRALSYLADNAARDIGPTDIATYTVVRVADEIVVDLLARACEITYENAAGNTETDEIAGVKIPYLSIPALMETKLGLRPKDMEDRRFLEALLRKREDGPAGS